MRHHGKVKIAVVQTASTDDKAANREAVVRWVAEAAAGRPDLVVLPEAMMADFAVEGGSVGGLAEALDGEFVSTLRKCALEHGTAIVAGMFERSCDEARPYNTLLAVGADGELLGAYRKIHLYDAFGYRESDQLTPGNVAPVVVRIGGVGFGLMTCYDLRFPELSRALVDAGAEVLVVPAAWVRGPLKEHHWATLLTARAIENTCYVAAAAQNGRKYSGLSQVLDPQGVAVAAVGEADGFATAEISADRLAEIRQRNPSLQNRRFTVAPR
ncbi:Nitrilase/cyanide hydratase and apolipoprotein N- acyltransferase [Kribbella flavida DSM 17836]|uniref:Nitrilase/cyanide hydratase and apolipoprotein N-acyltransferase n=1 Tax=Kribbella flavida (strain DSM 17836 / JCM 10339 / NBRC 14399) TaxID=479435 RepID=D2PS14_KRIFD|nr:Nitrilase/cyanide hydratase and apolipoprotein N- acyltransferase [Kribbella flavida DSM 17836]